MSRVFIALAAALAATLSTVPALAYDAYTTRIEPRGFYGATISIEEGVRVFRPLPPVRHVIVNPGGATPLNLNISDTRVEERSTNYNYNYGDGGGGAYFDRSYGIGGGFFPGFGKKPHGDKSAPAPGGVPAFSGGSPASGVGKGGQH